MTALPLSIEDRLAITDLVNRFFWLVDHGRAGETAELFTHDAKLTFGPGSPKPGITEGGAIRTMMIARAGHVHVTTRHVLSNMAFTANADGSVSVHTLMSLYRSDDETRSSVPASIADLDEIYVRCDDGWRIRERTVMPIFNRL